MAFPDGKRPGPRPSGAPSPKLCSRRPGLQCAIIWRHGTIWWSLSA